MNSLDTIRAIVSGANRTLAIALDDLPADLVNQRQPGNANPIGAICAHALINLDLFYHGAIQKAALVFVAGGYADQCGAEPARLDWEALCAINWEVATLQAYAQAVFDGVESNLATLTDAELGRGCQLFGNETTVAETIAVASWHTALHAGEIAALKGVHHRKGLPF
jgi:hypothetical protein